MSRNNLRPAQNLKEGTLGVRLATHFLFNTKFRILGTLPLFTLYAIMVWYLINPAVAQWLRCCATNRKVAGSIPDGVSGFLIDIQSFRSHYGPGVDSASNINEYQEYFLGAKAAGA